MRAYNGLTMEVRYVTVDPPERVAMTMLEGPPMFSKFAGTWLFEALGPKCTEVTFQYHYVLWPRWLSPVGEPIASRILKRDMRKRLEGLKESAETTDILDELDVS